MKNELALVSHALNPQAPTPLAQMVRASDGFLTAFGGVFCISVPYPINIGACFSPTAISPFFRKERGAIAFTIKKGKLQLKEGKEQLTIGCLPPEEMVTLAVLSKPVPCEFDTTHFKHAVDVVDPISGKLFAQGVTFRDGMMYSTNAAVFVAAQSGLPDELEFNLPHAACKALQRFKSPVVSIAQDQRSVCFNFEDGSSLTSLKLIENMVDIGFLFAGEWTPIKLEEDLLGLDCECVKFTSGNVEYSNDIFKGVIESVCNNKVNVAVGKVSLDFLLKASKDIRVSDDNNRLQSWGDSCRVICSTRHA